MVEDLDDRRPINPNTAGTEELMRLPGVGQTLAARIVANRPYGGAEDLSRVAGVGEASLERWRDQLEFGDREETQAPEPETEIGEPPASRDEEAPPSRGRSFSRGQTVALVLGVMLLGLACSVVVNLSLLAAINGSINFGRHKSVRQLRSDVAELALQSQEVDARLEALEQTLESVRGLSGRVSAVEHQIGELEAEVEQARVEFSSMRDRLEALQETTADLDRRVGRFDAFLRRLQELLSSLDQEGAPSGGLIPTPTPQEGS